MKFLYLFYLYLFIYLFIGVYNTLYYSFNEQIMLGSVAIPIYTTADPIQVLGRLNDMYNPNAAADIAISQTAEDNVERHKYRQDMQYSYETFEIIDEANSPHVCLR